MNYAWIGNEISLQNSFFFGQCGTLFYLVRYGAVRCIHLVIPDSYYDRQPEIINNPILTAAFLAAAAATAAIFFLGIICELFPQVKTFRKKISGSSTRMCVGLSHRFVFQDVPGVYGQLAPWSIRF